jgi:hypothetical protein
MELVDTKSVAGADPTKTMMKITNTLTGVVSYLVYNKSGKRPKLMQRLGFLSEFLFPNSSKRLIRNQSPCC